ncbi:hypothetical protein [Streptomyces sp. CB03234]|uniref:hypothetical protein n=1 Tax=Streptomyces sp. (strain CB03234) TaxID=1703937 RepID=UPI00117CA32A
MVRGLAALHEPGALGQRPSPLLPYVPPQLSYRMDRAAGRVEALRSLERRLGPALARALHGR